MPTTNVVTTQTGTGFTIDVTACNLLSDITVKDFYVLHAGTLFCDGQVDGCSAYTKVTGTSVQYGGTALGTNTTVEVRRKTPRSVIQIINYANRFASSLWNSELDRIVRRAEEYDLNGVGAGTQQQNANPDNTAYPTTWATDTVKPPTKQAAYNIISTLAPLASPALTGTPTTTTPVTADSSTKVASTAYVQNNLVNYATLASPTLTGTPVSTTPATTDNSTKIATTAFINNLFADSNAQPGYIKFPGNLMIQFGSSVAATNAGGEIAIAFPQTFATYRSCIVCNGDPTASQVAFFITNTGSTTTSALVVRAVNCTTGAVIGSTTLRCNWIAYGTY